ncbi:MAG TPA: hypothetical protein P5121_39760 [Caldilineaceae bacterium]|nr:hypothetical protein [Caldilineaceae bacterium]
MFVNSPFVTSRQGRYVRSGGNGLSLLVMIPGILLTLMALAILVWPELLAYMVAGAMLFGGLSLLTWGWRIQQLAKRAERQSTVVHYDVY